jgi:hypothetical protein
MQWIFSLFIFDGKPVQCYIIFSCFPAQILNFNHAKLQNLHQKWKSRVSKCNEYSNHWWLMINQRCAIIFIVVSWHKFKISTMPNFKISVGNENRLYQNAMNFQFIDYWCILSGPARNNKAASKKCRRYYCGLSNISFWWSRAWPIKLLSYRLLNTL